MARVAQCHRPIYSVTWHTMTHPTISLSEAIQVFGISKRTIERKIASGDIGRDQIRLEGGKRHFLMAELIRVF
ncbi:hypothetical protein MSR1_08830 [Magnetospirillum gryphiswaldense MSR-1]|uniref:Helix-turn-helix domain-containing protein n=1 Tax=Magnetospirillum gryphiswaldense TaxID=55518 RepID=A4U0E2_9PROT|nr:hypothetical protein MSR1_08830 [Magnetospirillum gryphiswaldense MSR-1]AVM77289.1 hypothetical protein MSR1L_08830 [Magnetospirillum gryphiswaldense]CAM76349.1 hypothetical protein MGR_0385 [Magnetospirillum gryphiswaldense MSR-1]